LTFAGASRFDNSPLLESERPTHVRYVVLAFLCVLSFLTYFDRICIMSVQADIQRDLHINDFQMGWIFSAFWLAYAIFEIPGGWLGERFGSRGTLTRIVLAWSACTALTGAAGGFISLLCWRFLFGAGEAGAYPNIARVQSRWLPAQSQGRASGTLWLVARWGGAASPLLFGWLLMGFGSHAFRSGVAGIAALHGLASMPAWRLGFWACGLAGIAWVILFYPFFRDDPAAKRSVNAAELQLIRSGAPDREDRAQHAAPRDRRVWKALFSSGDLWALCFFYVFGSFGWSFFVSWVPKYLKAQGVDYSHSHLMSGLPLFCGGVACLVGGWVSDYIVRRTGRLRLGRAVLPVAGRIVAAGAVFGLRYVHSAHYAVALMCLTMMAYDFGQGASWAAIIDIGGAHCGLAAGLVNTVGNLGGNVAQPIIGALIFNHFGWPTLFAVYAMTYLLSGAMWLFIHPDREFFPGRGGEC